MTFGRCVSLLPATAFHRMDIDIIDRRHSNEHIVQLSSNIIDQAASVENLPKTMKTIQQCK